MFVFTLCMATSFTVTLAQNQLFNFLTICKDIGGIVRCLIWSNVNKESFGEVSDKPCVEFCSLVARLFFFLNMYICPCK